MHCWINTISQVQILTWTSVLVSVSQGSCTGGLRNTEERIGSSMWWRTMWEWMVRRTAWRSAWPAGWSLPMTSTRTSPWPRPIMLFALGQLSLAHSSVISASPSPTPPLLRPPSPVPRRYPRRSPSAGPPLQANKMTSAADLWDFFLLHFFIMVLCKQWKKTIKSLDTVRILPLIYELQGCSITTIYAVKCDVFSNAVQMR